MNALEGPVRHTSCPYRQQASSSHPARTRQHGSLIPPKSIQQPSVQCRASPSRGTRDFSGMTTLHEGSPRARRRSGPSSSPTFDQEALSPRAVCTHAAKISDKSASADSQILVGQLCIAACALLWGTYAPALRLAYNSPLPPDPAVVTAIRAMIQAAVLYTLLQLQTNDQGKLADDHGGADGEEMSAQGQSGDKLDASQPLAFARRLLNTTSGSFWIMGAELGFWNFAATVAQAEGLEFTSATRGSFLMSVTALLTPALAILAGEATTRSTIIASVLAVFGVGLIVLDDTAGVPGVSPTYQMIGDVAVLVSACFYSLLTVRIGRYARQAAPVRLASSKSTALAAIALASLGVLAVKRGLSGEGVSSLWGNPFDLVALGAIGWAALGPGASAAFLQSKGQGVVPASQTQVILTSVPLWSAIFAAWLVPGESMGPLAWAGGGTLLISGVISVAAKGK